MDLSKLNKHVIVALTSTFKIMDLLVVFMNMIFTLTFIPMKLFYLFVIILICLYVYDLILIGNNPILFKH